MLATRKAQMRHRKPMPPLPPPCRDCRPQDGAWRVDPFTGGLERCGCPRGQVLANMRRGRRTAPKADAHDYGKAAAGDRT
jgi:hypothetical protein